MNPITPEFELFVGNLITTQKEGRTLYLLPEVSKQDRWYTLSEIYTIFNKDYLKAT